MCFITLLFFFYFLSPPSNSSLFFNLDKIPPPGGGIGQNIYPCRGRYSVANHYYDQGLAVVQEDNL